MSNSILRTVRFTTDAFSDLEALAAELTALKALATRTPTPVTVEQLEQIAAAGDLCNLFLQVNESDVVVGWCMLTTSLFEDTAHLGPIAVQKEDEHAGFGTPLMQDSLAYVFEHYPAIRRIDLTNRPDHNLEAWYRKFGFVPRTEAEGDPTTVYRLQRSA